MSNLTVTSTQDNTDYFRGDTNQNPVGLRYWALVGEDLRTHEGNLFAQGFWAIFNHRFGNWRMGLRSKLIRAPMTFVYLFWRKLVQILAGIDVPYTTKLGRRVKFEHFGGMILVAREIGDDVIIRQNTTFGVRDVNDLKGRPIIGNRVDVGAGAVIIGGVSIGDGARIGANAVVINDVPAGALAVGVPARVIVDGVTADVP
ncbi:MAG: transferase [Alphaproteobacteria bacterium]|nr:transferase [Alphaproteobacteria bacterium]